MKIISKSILFSSAVIFSGALGYLYQIIAARFLSNSDYSLLIASLSVVTIFGSFGGGLFLKISKHIAHLNYHSANLSILNFYKQINFYLIIFITLFTPFVIIFESLLLEILNADLKYLVYLIYAIVSLNLFYVFNNSVLQGLKKITFLSFINIYYALSKLALLFICFLFSNGIFSALKSFVISLFSTIIISIFYVYKLLVNKKKFNKFKNKIEVFRVFDKTTLGFSLSVGIFIFIAQFDVIVSNKILLPEDRGIYAAISVIGKSIFYLSSGIAMTIFPFAVDQYESKVKTKNLIKNSIFLSIFFMFISIVFFYFFGDLIFRIFFGESFGLNNSLYLIFYSLAVAPLALIYVMEYYLLAQGKIFFAWLFLIFLPIQIFLYFNMTYSILGIILVYGLTSFLIMTLGLYFIFAKNN